MSIIDLLIHTQLVPTMKNLDVLVTTSSTIEGREIEEYYEPITSHLVIGMNFFKDLFSGLTDFFGGNSQSYQKTLDRINSEAIDQLKYKAKILGANCILDLRIDNDEISAQGKSMLMVTAIGMAAKLKTENSEKSTNFNSKTSISDIAFNILKKKQLYLESAKNDSLAYIDETWRFLIENQLEEFSELVIEYFDKKSVSHMPDFESKMVEFFGHLPSEISKEKLYSNLIKEELSISTKNQILEIIKSNKLLDYNIVYSNLITSDFHQGILLMKTLKSEKSEYITNDLHALENIKKLIQEKYPIKVSFSEKKKGLTSKLTSIWGCECGKENNKDSMSCSKCSKDQRGIDSNTLVFDKLLEKISQDIAVLQEVFK
ncbi:YbjQ family protein [Roseivirga pacifica]|uniref:YbjQ family protein n=1 Tax=Roseivirga pacifica TaxID=1267423 RepID=UPI003BA96540